MSMLAANLICLALVAVDLAARTWRIQWLCWGTHHRISFFDSLVLNCVGDAAAALTPNRVAGEPARLGGMVLSRVPASAGLVAIAVETVVMWAVNIAVGVWLAVKYAPEWWQAAGPALTRHSRHAWPWVIAIVVTGAIAWWVVRRYAPALSHSMRRGTRRLVVYARRMPTWPMVMGLVTTFVSVMARVSMLPVLAATQMHAPPVGALMFVSYTLIFGQLLLPTPSGAGVVEFGFLGGAVGNLGEGDKTLLLLWRFYATVLLVGLGLVLGLFRYGPKAVEAIVEGKAAKAALTAAGSELREEG